MSGASASSSPAIDLLTAGPVLDVRCGLPPELVARLTARLQQEPGAEPRRVVVVRDDAAHVAAAFREDDAPRVVALAERSDRLNVTRLLRAGALAVVPALEAEASLEAVLVAVIAGFVVAPREAGQALRQPLLSHREKQVLAMLVTGLTNREIAERLYLTESTVKSHVSAVFGTLGVASRKEATAIVLDQAGLLRDQLGLAALQSPTS